MKRQSSAGRLWIVLGAAACMLSVAGWSLRDTQAQAPAAEETEEAAAEEDAAEEAPAEDAAEEEDVAELPIPEGDAEAIDEFIKKLAQSEAQGDTQEEQIAHAKKILGKIREAAGKMLEADPTEEQSLLASRYELMALQGLNQFGEEGAAEAYDAAIEKAMADERPQMAMLGWQAYVYGRVGAWDTLDEKARNEFGNRLFQEIKKDGASPNDINLVVMTAQALEHMDEDFAGKLLKAAIPMFQKSEVEGVKEMLADSGLEGMLRRFTLMGNEMELFGDLLGGGEFDWKSYEGKVVLVDFSATWCPPCRAEAPNVLDMYNKYHEKGFDVVAISLDRTPEDAQKYIDENGIKWATIFPEKEEDRFWSHPLVKYYGVGGIPTAILVGADGKVVHMNARDQALRDALEELLGDPAEAATSSDSGAEEAGG